MVVAVVAVMVGVAMEVAVAGVTADEVVPLYTEGLAAAAKEAAARVGAVMAMAVVEAVRARAVAVMDVGVRGAAEATAMAAEARARVGAVMVMAAVAVSAARPFSIRMRLLAHRLGWRRHFRRRASG